jgi:peptidoglycan/LPS O-acetylase OafA/YrhL
VVGIAVYIGIKRIKSARRGEPSEDELTKKIMVKTASVSYYISIYLWLFIGFFSDRLNLANHTLIGIGISGMAMVYVLSWVIISLRGLRDE